MAAGVASGLAEHLGTSTRLIRIGFVLLAVTGGAGFALYGALWLLAPLRPDLDPRPASAGQAAAPGVRSPDDDRSARLGPLLALGAVGIGVLLLLSEAGVRSGPAGAAPLLVVGLGVAVLWRVGDDAQRARWRRTAAESATGTRAWVRIVIGLVFVLVGCGAILAARVGVKAAVDGVAGGLAVLAGVAVVAGPWLIRTTRELTDERRERIRSQERAEIAAHVHDSVLQTLTLIQRNADDPRAVVQLARVEERALRSWLYRPDGADPTRFRAGLEAIAADVEELHGGTIDVVVVGDEPVDDAMAALLQAAREAMVNAVKYAAAGGPVSVYAELEPTQASVFVRDRGQGFEVDAIPADRLGVRQSIIGRMERHGGRAEVRSEPGEGVEVRLILPRSPAVESAPPDAAPAGSVTGERL